MKKGFLKHIVLSFLMLLCWISLIVCALSYAFLTTTWGAKIAATYLIEAYIPFCKVDIGTYKGTIEKGLILKNVVISNIPTLKEGSLSIQELYLQIPLIEWHKISMKFTDARVQLKDAEPIIFNGTVVHNQLQGTCYAHSLDARQILLALGYDDLGKSIYGFISHVDFVISGNVFAPRFKGHFIVDKFICKDTQVNEGFGRLEVVIKALGDNPLMEGDIFLESAVVETHKINIDLNTSKASFSGDVGNPNLDIHGSSKVEDIVIDMAIKGSLQKPQFILNSDPPMPQDEILAVLFTGKSWSELGKDQASAFGLRKKLTDAFNVGMEFEERSSQPGQSQTTGYSKTIEGQMNLTDKLTVNVAKKYYPTSETTPTTGNNSQSNETQFYLQYKKRF